MFSNLLLLLVTGLNERIPRLRDRFTVWLLGYEKKNYTHLIPAKYRKASCATACLFLRLLFCSVLLSGVLRLFSVLNDSPSAQKEYTNLLLVELCVYVCVGAGGCAMDDWMDG
jgi:hypothetical protein